MDEAPALRAGAAQRPPRDAVHLEEAVDGGLRQLPAVHLLRALQHTDDALHRAPRLLQLEAEDELDQLVGDGAGLVRVAAPLRVQRGEAIAAVGVQPVLDGARGHVDEGAAGQLPRARGGLSAELHQLAVLEPGTDERPEDGDAEERELLAGLFIHVADVGGPKRHSGWERLGRPSLAEIHGGYMRRSPGLSRCSRAASGASSEGLSVAAAYAFVSAPREASSPTRCATARSIGAPEVASACVAARAVCASRAFHRCTVRAGTCGRPPSEIAASTASQVRHRHRARKAGSTRQVAKHFAHRKITTVTTALPGPTALRSRLSCRCSRVHPHRHSAGRYEAGSFIIASCAESSSTRSSMSVPPYRPLDASLETRHVCAAGGTAHRGSMRLRSRKLEVPQTPPALRLSC